MEQRLLEKVDEGEGGVMDFLEKDVLCVCSLFFFV